jgi:hypothetical protein
MSFRRRDLLQGAALFAGALPALAEGAPTPRPTTAAEVWVRTELYFGTDRAGGTPVTDAEFNDFLAREVTERFPDGLTLLSGYGQFRSSTGALIREKSFLLILFYPPQMQDANSRIQQIRDRYKAAFGQESVLRTDGFTFLSF